PARPQARHPGLPADRRAAAAGAGLLAAQRPAGRGLRPPGRHLERSLFTIALLSQFGRAGTLGVAGYTGPKLVELFTVRMNDPPTRRAALAASLHPAALDPTIHRRIGHVQHPYQVRN